MQAGGLFRASFLAYDFADRFQGLRSLIGLFFKAAFGVFAQHPPLAVAPSFPGGLRKPDRSEIGHPWFLGFGGSRPYYEGAGARVCVAWALGGRSLKEGRRVLKSHGKPPQSCAP